ncbi:hypothetical protein M427DRAFT_52236 [Gonapodya prolifera JEL478]|uniref:Mediator of RNA polymerase II transcription subunit 6 n=1 Tax=Gonapodya prolifera (strain JEL478) TaxID=1344416 RepID=A0A139AV90_GONPJ|nr:hypothetical protein M427DRAFT_52236 [Gonapodya prolifera JEL478]|eukprot:KXS20651.1 hypothetical protein M427DRAFT_52236 [Gonapodya prolifera JEL478]
MSTTTSTTIASAYEVVGVDMPFYDHLGRLQHPDHALTYLARFERFWDTSSVNQMRMTQMQFRDSERRKEMEGSFTSGVEYIVDIEKSQPPELWIVRKERIESADSRHLISMYYISKGVVFQAPDLQTLLVSRLRNALYFCQKGLEELRERQTFTGEGYAWD